MCVVVVCQEWVMMSLYEWARSRCLHGITAFASGRAVVAE